MSTAKKTSGLFLASAAAALLANAPVSAQDVKATDMGKCWGVNSCKGSSNCKTLTNSCAGKNACKSQGFLKMTFQQCNELAGDFEKLPDR